MCLIAYVPAGKTIPDENIVAANAGNEDGIGIMHEGTFTKFLGKKKLKKARRYVHRLQDARTEFAIHFRYATHGAVVPANTHPFKLPPVDGYLMHNGVLTAYTDKAPHLKSDTRVFVDTLDDMHLVLDTPEEPKYWETIKAHIGWGNKLCLMLPAGNAWRFKIINEHAGEWIDGVWYSQTYSLDYRGKYDHYMRYDWPTRTYETGNAVTVQASSRELAELAAQDPYTSKLKDRIGYAYGLDSETVIHKANGETVTFIRDPATGAWEEVDPDDMNDDMRYARWQNSYAAHNQAVTSERIARRLQLLHNRESVLDKELAEHLADSDVESKQSDDDYRDMMLKAGME